MGHLKISKYNKYLIGALLALVLIAVSVFGFIKFLNRGLLVIKVEPRECTLNIDGQAMGNIDKTKKIWLKPGIYEITLDKDNYLESTNLIKVQTWRKTKLDAVLLDMAYIGLIEDDNTFNNFPTYSGDNQGIIYYSNRDRVFYKSNYEKTYKIADGQSEKIGPDLPLSEKSRVSEIRYSSDNNQAALTYAESDGQNKSLLVNLLSNQANVLEGDYSSLDWLSNSEVIGIENVGNSQNLIKISLPGLNRLLIASLTTEAMEVYAINKGQEVVVLNDSNTDDDNNDYLVVNAETGAQQKNKIDNSYISSVIKSQNSNNFVLVVSQEENNQFYLTQGSGEPEKLDADSLVDLGTLSKDGGAFYYIFYDENNDLFITKKFTFDNKYLQEISKYNTSNFSEMPNAIFTNDLYLNYIIDNNILNLKL